VSSFNLDSISRIQSSSSPMYSPALGFTKKGGTVVYFLLVSSRPCPDKGEVGGGRPEGHCQCNGVPLLLPFLVTVPGDLWNWSQIQSRLRSKWSRDF
jgi:hypothetical protein